MFYKRILIRYIILYNTETHADIFGYCITDIFHRKTRKKNAYRELKKIIGPVPSKDMQTQPAHPLFRSGHLDIKDVQCAKTKDMLKISYHIILRSGVQKWLGHPKIQLSSKVTRFAKFEIVRPSFYSAVDVIWNFTPIILFSTLHIFYVKMATSLERGEVCIFLVGKQPKCSMSQNLEMKILFNEKM